MRKHIRGLTLAELLIVLALLGILFGVGLPNATALLVGAKQTNAVNRLLGHIQLTRHTAAQLRTIATLCPAPRHGSTDGRCGTDWNAGYRVFADRNGNAQLDADDDVLVAEDQPIAGMRINWRAFRRRSYLQFDATGVTRALNGSFVLCPAGATRAERRLVINLAGRTRIERLAPGIGPAC